MAFRCDICGKKKRIGKSGAHKYGGKWAMRATKKTKVWRPNLQSYIIDGVKFRLCTRCIKRAKFNQKKKDELKKVVEEKPEVKETEEKIEEPVAKKTSRKTKKSAK